MGGIVPILSPNDHLKASRMRQKEFRKMHIFETTLQVLLNNPKSSNLVAFEGPMARAIWAEQLPRGSPWVLEYLHYRQRITKTHPKGNRGISGK